MRHEWISVKKRFPDKEGRYLVCNEEEIFVEYYSSRHRTIWKSAGITDWMLLPEMPGEKKYPF